MLSINILAINFAGQNSICAEGVGQGVLLHLYIRWSSHKVSYKSKPWARCTVQEKYFSTTSCYLQCEPFWN